MSILLLGLAIFLGVHMLTTLRPARAAAIGRLGEGPYKGLYSLAWPLAPVLLAWAFARYRPGAHIPVWDPPMMLLPLTWGLMWLSFVALVAANAPPGKLKSMLRHPMLVGVKLWALAHLLVNGDLGSLILFGAFLAFAVYDRIAVKRRGDTGAPPAPGFTSGDAIALGIGTALYAAMFWLHPWLIGVPIS